MRRRIHIPFKEKPERALRVYTGRMKNTGFTNSETKQFDPGGPLSTPAQRQKVPADHFLMPDQRKYPYKDSDGKISCNLLRAAIARAGQNKQKAVEAKARSLFNNHCAA